MNKTKRRYKSSRRRISSKFLSLGLERFSDIYLELDTEDRERICTYFEELMDIVGLESSGGYLNDFMYGFDPTEIIKKE